MSDKLFSEDFQQNPYWWVRTPRPMRPEQPLPESADVVVIGSGYTGLSAAIQTAKRGLSTVVVDAEDLGWGCSSRNGGQVSPSLKPSVEQLAKKYGRQRALAILREGNHAQAWVESFIHEQQIDCDYRQVGRFHAAHTPAAFEALATKIKQLPPELNHDAYLVAREDQQQEIDGDFYHGGAVYPHHASLDPGRYHQGLLRCADQQGVTLIPQCRVTSIDKRGASLLLTTEQGRISARDVIIATSGYTGSISRWQQRRVVPIGSYVIATEPLPEGTLERLIVNDRVITDTRKLVVYYRSCPERQRILFGGRVSLRETDTRRSAQQLHQEMTRRFPELAGVKVSHSWMGFIGYTFDEMPHLGKHDGIYYCMGYCGAGISLSSYFGARIGQQLAGDPQGDTALDGLPFRGRVYYRSKPWFLAPAVAYYRWRDERTARSP